MLTAATILALAQQCAPSVHPGTMAAIVRVESGGNPYAIGVVGGRLQRQPKNKEEAIATAQALEKGGWNFSMGIGQVNRYNLARYGLTYETVVDPCQNLKAASGILSECYSRASAHKEHKDNAMQAALSCYYSGNFTTGFRHGYVQKVVSNAPKAVPELLPAATVPAIPVISNAKGGTATPVKIRRAAQQAVPEIEAQRTQDPIPERNPALVF